MSKYSTKTKQKKQSFYRSPLFVVVLVVAFFALSLAGVFAYAKNQDETPTSSTDTSTEADALPEVKQTAPEQQTPVDYVKDVPPSSQPGAEQSVNVIITDAVYYEGNVEVRAFVSNLTQNGTCTYRFAKGSASVVRETKSSVEASSTICTSISVPRSDFPSGGTWKIAVAFKAGEKSGVSQERSVNL